MLTTERLRPQLNTRYLHLKSWLDLLAAAVMLLLLGPLLLLIALVIRLDSPGPVLYRQRRIGRGGVEFTIYKFRTMKVGTPSLSTEEMQRRGVVPFTRLGPVLRKTSLDELPQLLNILKGEMSFIGPRPALPTQVDVNTLREQQGVHAVRPGITGLAQVMGRDDLDTLTKVRFDAEYCRRLSLAHDARLVWLTAKAVLSARGNK